MTRRSLDRQANGCSIERLLTPACLLLRGETAVTRSTLGDSQDFLRVHRRRCSP
jgi:hypothetical protein